MYDKINELYRKLRNAGDALQKSATDLAWTIRRREELKEINKEFGVVVDDHAKIKKLIDELNALNPNGEHP